MSLEELLCPTERIYEIFKSVGIYLYSLAEIVFFPGSRQSRGIEWYNRQLNLLQLFHLFSLPCAGLGQALFLPPKLLLCCASMFDGSNIMIKGGTFTFAGNINSAIPSRSHWLGFQRSLILEYHRRTGCEYLSKFCHWIESQTWLKLLRPTRSGIHQRLF